MEDYDFLKDAKLQGDELLATYFFREAEEMMLMAFGENVNGEKEGPATVYLYMFNDGEVSHGVDTLVFLDRDELHKFIKELPTMSALDFIMRTVACPPSIIVD